MENIITRNSEVYQKLIAKIRTMENAVEAMKAGNLSCTARWLNGDAVMRKLGVSRRTLQTYRDSRILPYSVVGGKFYYSLRDIEEMMMSNYVSVNFANN
jgi:hypothetical protein